MEENNKNLIQETLENIKNLKNTVKKSEIKCFLSKETDSNDCFLEIHAGAGGTESQDWAEMLRRMYMKWAQSKEFKNHIISCLLYTSPSPRDPWKSRMPSSA